MPVGYFAKYGDLLLNKYGNNCWYCGVEMTPKTISVDHINPRKKGGGDDLDNMRLACRSCNTRKGAKSLSRLRLIIQLSKSDHPKCITPRVYLVLKNDYGIDLGLPDHEFYFESVDYQNRLKRQLEDLGRRVGTSVLL